MSKQPQKVWHLSHGLVFSGDDKVVYPRLPSARFHSSPSVVSHGDLVDEASMKFAQPETRSQSTGLLESGERPLGLPLPSPPKGDVETGTEDQAATSASRSGGEKTASIVGLEPPFTPLDFKMPDPLFREAKLAEPGSPESFWSYSLYRSTPGDGNPESKVKVHYCKSQHTTERVLQQYFMNEKVLGFDLEWQPEATKNHGPRKNVCLVQLASSSRIALFHLSLYPKNDDLVAPSLKKLMEDPGITKTGVWIKGDCTRLRTFLGIDSRGTFELSHLYKLVKFSATGQHGLINKKLVGLAQQVEEHLGLPLFKGQNVRSSDWSQSLNMNQIIYSASDAYAAVQLYAVLDHLRESLSPTPPLPYHAELNKPIRLAAGIAAASTADEAVEAEPEDTSSTANKEGPVLPAKYLRAFGDSINVEQESDFSEPILLPAAAKPAKAEPRPKDPKVVEAETWLAQFRVSHPKSRASPSSLRAYYLWYRNEALKPADVAALLREPPLQTNTVINYVLEAIKHEKLSFQKARLKTEVLDQLPKEVVGMRYKSIVKMCEDGAKPTGAES